MRLLRNPEAVLAALAACRERLEAGAPVVLELKTVRCFDLAAALLITALVNRKWHRGARFTTDIPRSPQAMDFLAHSGVLAHVGWVTPNGRPPRRIRVQMARASGVVEKEGQIEVGASRAQAITRYVQSIFVDSRSRGSRGWNVGRAVYKVLIELMNNTAQHAGTPGTQRWWVAARRTPSGAVEVSFLDLGAGVVRTLRRRLTESLKEAFGHAATDATLLEDLMTSRLQHILTLSATGLPSRGNGFQEMQRAVANHSFKLLTIVANGAICRLQPSTPLTGRLASPLAGTLVHFVVLP